MNIISTAVLKYYNKHNVELWQNRHSKLMQNQIIKPHPNAYGICGTWFRCH